MRETILILFELDILVISFLSAYVVISNYWLSLRYHLYRRSSFGRKED